MNKYPDTSFPTRVRDLQKILRPKKIRFKFSTNMEKEPVIFCVATTYTEACRRLNACVSKTVTIGYRGEHPVGRALGY